MTGMALTVALAGLLMAGGALYALRCRSPRVREVLEGLFDADVCRWEDDGGPAYTTA